MRRNSLKGKKNFQEVFNKGKRLRQPELQLIILQRSKKETDLRNNNESNPRQACGEINPSKIKKVSVPDSGLKIGISINKKYGNAVTRNRTRRRIRAICREILEGADADYLIVIQPREEFKKLSYADSKEIIKGLFIRAGVL